MDQHTPSLQEQMLRALGDARLLDEAGTYARKFLSSIGTREVYPQPEALMALSRFDEPMPDEPGDPEGILRLLHEAGSPATVLNAGGRYFGFVTGGALPAAVAVKWLADVWDQNAALYVLSPIASQIERVCERWVIDLLGLPTECAAGFVSGTSTATLAGLAAGRNELLRRQGWDVNARGLFGAPELRVIIGREAHATVLKALSILGLGRDRVEWVPVDGQGRIRVDRMPPLDDRCLIIAQAGNVNSGSFDAFDEIGQRAQAAGAWVHIDGAFGLWAAASRTYAPLVKGIETAHSWSVDAHKTLNAPYDSGIVLCRDPKALVRALQATDDYIQYSQQRDGMLYTPEMSRQARGFELWATLKCLGRSGIDELITRLCRHAGHFAARLRSLGFHVLNDVVFNQVLVACDHPELTKATLARIQQSGECWCGSTQWQGRFAIRISICSWATTAEDIERSARAFAAARKAAMADARGQRARHLLQRRPPSGGNQG